MFNVFLLLAVLAIITAIELPPLIHKKMWGEIATFSVIMLLGGALSMALVLGIELPNPTEFLMETLQPVSDAIFLRQPSG